MSLDKVSLFSSKRDFFLFLSLSLFIFIYATLIEYNNYKNLTQFTSHILTATIVKQYTKTKLTKKGKTKTYQVLKLKAEKGFSFYTIRKKDFPDSQGKKIDIEIFSTDISFYQYLTSFFSFSRLITIHNSKSLKYTLSKYLIEIHSDKDVSSIYKALYSATSLPKHLQQTFSQLGISHLLAISGFHLGVLSLVLFFLLKMPYKFFQNRYFPYRSYKRDSFFIIIGILFIYMLFLDTPASLLRAFVMLLIGFFLYDRGYKIISMMTLLLTVILIISFAPRLLFSLGFWLSVFGVFYIFLFIIHFKHLSKLWQFLLIPIWVYLMMLPVSLFIFEAFSIYHPFSIILTSLFTLFYPLSIVLHIIDFGSLLDSYLLWILNVVDNQNTVRISKEVILIFAFVSFISIWKKIFIYLLLSLSLFIFIYSIYQVT